MFNSEKFPEKILMLVALLQGLALLLLHQAIEFEFWPHNAPQWLFVFYSIAITAPIILLLGLESDKPNWVYKGTLVFAAVLLFLGYYAGKQVTPLQHIKFETVLIAFVLTLCVATFKLLMYAQHLAKGLPLSYSLLFTLSWRNFLTLALSLLFTLCLWGVLMLWAGLFKAIKVNFFYDLFIEEWFYYPILALGNGFGVIIFRNQSNVIDTITRIQQALMKFLLVILVFISILFLFALPFTGLAPLWDTGGSTLILWMQALMLFALNAVYQDSPESRPYGLILHRFIYIGIALLPVYSLISCYGLVIRIEQYGWSVLRFWGFLVWFIFALFSLGYLFGIAKYRDNWLQHLSWVNVRMGLFVLLLALIVNTPLLDPRKITVASQLSRLDEGLVTLEEFDFRYFRYDLAAPGYYALQDIKARVSESKPEIALRIDAYYSKYGAKPADEALAKRTLLSAIKYKGDVIPQALSEKIYADVLSQPWRMKTNIAYHLDTVDLDRDGTSEYVLLEERKDRVQLMLFYHESGSWDKLELSATKGYTFDSSRVLDAFKTSELTVVEPKWKELDIGGVGFRVR